MRFLQHSVLAFVLAMGVAGPGGDEIVDALDKMRELHVGAHVFPALRDGLFRQLSLLAGMRETFLDCLAYSRRKLVGKCIDIAVGERLVGRGDCGIDTARWLEPIEPFAFAGTVNPDQGLEEVLIRGVTFLSAIAR